LAEVNAIPSSQAATGTKMGDSIFYLAVVPERSLLLKIEQRLEQTGTPSISLPCKKTKENSVLLF